MTRSLVACCLFGLVALASARPASGQDSPRTGFFIGAGLGWGSLGVEGSDGRFGGGLSGYFRMGAAVSQRVLVGVESNAFKKEENGATLTSNHFSVVAYFYPDASGHFYMRGGAGLAHWSTDSEFVDVAQNGISVSAGAGYDIMVGQSVALTPFGNLVFGFSGDGSTNIIQLGLGLNSF